MDLAYDHIAEHTYSEERSETPKPGDAAGSTQQETTSQRSDLQTEFQETFKAFSNSPWGAKLGGWWGTAKKQGESYYETARKEAEKREVDAAKAFEDIRKQVEERTKTVIEFTEEQLDKVVNEEKKAEQRAKAEAEAQAQAQAQTQAQGEQQEGSRSNEEALKDNETLTNRFKSEAAKRLKEVQKAEDAADEALLRFGTNIRKFLKDAVSISAPEPNTNRRASEVLFESQDATTGHRVIHTSRFDAQLHVIHTTASSFTEDPDISGGQWEEFKKEFDIDERTDTIAKDLETYKELRTAMERLVPEQVEYKDFWSRYYFLRHVVEMQEKKRREILKATADGDEEEVGWDEDSDEEQLHSKTPTLHINEPDSDKADAGSNSDAAEENHPHPDAETMTLRPSRRSHDEKSVAESDASYDLISGAASHATSSPKEKAAKADESDEEDWE